MWHNNRYEFEANEFEFMQIKDAIKKENNLDIMKPEKGELSPLYIYRKDQSVFFIESLSIGDYILIMGLNQSRPDVYSSKYKFKVFAEAISTNKEVVNKALENLKTIVNEKIGLEHLL